MSSPVPPGGVLSAAASAAGPTLLRSASAVAAKPVKAFQVFRIDGFSWAKTMLPGGERVSSQPFHAGGRTWQVDLYPNGADGTKDAAADSVALYLRMVSGSTGRVRVQYKFSLLDLATGDAAYELPAETGTLPPCPRGGPYAYYAAAAAAGPDDEAGRLGYAEFIAWAELERRRESLLADDCLAVRCDVGVMELEFLPLDIEPPQYNDYYPYGPYCRAGPIPPPPTAPPPGPGYFPGHRSSVPSYRGENHNYYGAGDGDTSDRDEGNRHQQQPPDDREYVRRCLVAKRQRTDRDE